MWRNPMPWKNSPETPNIGTWAQTDDMRPGLGYSGLENLQNFVKRGGVMVGATNTADFAIQFGLTNGVSSNSPRRGEVVGSFLRTRIVDDASPIVYGVSDNLAMYSNNGESFSVSSSRGGGVAAAAAAGAPAARRARPAAARRTMPIRCRDSRSSTRASCRRRARRCSRGSTRR